MGYRRREDGRPNFRGIGTPFGSMHGRARLTEALVTELRAQWSIEKYRQGFLQKWAAEHGVDYATAYRALVGESWTHVKGAVKARKAPGRSAAAVKREAKKRRKR